MQLSKTTLIIFLIFIAKISFSQDYSVSTISDSIRENANIVVRLNQQKFSIKNTENATEKVKYVITIFNEKAAKEYGFLAVSYDKFSKIKKISAKIYDKDGKLIDKSQKRDINDFSMVSSSSLFDDNRVKVISFPYDKYPYTVEYEYTKEHKGSLFYPTWTPYMDFGFNIGVEKSRFTITCPNYMSFRKKEVLIKYPVEIDKEDFFTSYTWQINNLKAIDYEMFSPPRTQIIPHIKFAPNDFQMDGYEGNMETWESFGGWLNLLNSGKIELPEGTEVKVNELISEAKDTVEMVKIIYEYMQSKTRYVSIQVGIGGWQPFEAEFVDEKGYGDCKALSNYTKALLEVAGIKSHYTIVQSGKYPMEIDPNFTTNTFNHVILCVPVANDTIWLECTSQKAPFGYLGTFTDDRNVLIVTDKGGKLVRTKKYEQHENIQTRIAKVEILENGNAEANIKTDYKGLKYDAINRAFHYSPEEQKQWLYNKTEIADFKINSFSFSEDRNNFIPTATEDLDLEITNFSQKTGNRLFINLNLMNKFTFSYSTRKKRKNDIYIRRAFIEIDSITYQFPEKYKIEYAPDKETINSKFGNYEYSVKVKDNEITYTRIFKINKGQYPASDYKELTDFFDKITKADKQKVVLVTGY